MKKILNGGAMEFLENYINTDSPTGFEEKGQRVWINYVKKYVNSVHIDNYGTVYGVIKSGKKDALKVVIEAHADEISYFVHKIDSNGIIRVERNGGSDPQIAPSKRVHIHTRKKGIVDGIFGWPAIHLRHGKNPDMDTIFIDVGAKDDKAVKEMGISVGDVITYEDDFKIMGDYYMGKSLDNKMGGFMIAQVARHISKSKEKLPFDLYIVNSVQEEIGLRGAQMVTDTIKPDCAIITDVTHDTSTPHIDQVKHGDVKCGSGPALTVGSAVHNKMLNLIRDTAESKGIDIQMMASSRSTLTDTDAFAYSNGGVPSALISLPQRYMHTTNEMVHRDDVENVIRLIYETLWNIKGDHNFKYFKP